MTPKPKLLVLSLSLAVGVAIASAAGAADKDPKEAKAGRPTPAVMKDIKEGKAKQLKTGKRTTGVWDGCTFHYLKTDESTYEFDDGSQATVSENPEPLPPKTCAEPRNPTAAEMAGMEKRVGELNPKQPQVPGGPPPPTPGDRPTDAYGGGTPAPRP